MALAFIVEGRQEQRVVHRMCDCDAPRINNGDSVSLSKLAENIRVQLELFSDRYYPIIIVFDRENREESADEIISEVKRKLEEFKIDISQLIIGVPDRTIESWILPFIDENGQFLEVPQKISDDISSQNELKNRMEKKGDPYRKTANGVNLFLRINPSELAKVSESFSKFYEELKQHDLFQQVAGNCYWLNR